jgi:hypothetical protein
MRRTLCTLLIISGVTRAFTQDLSKLEQLFQKQFSAKSKEDGRWVFDPNQAYIRKLRAPIISDILPGHSFYGVRLTNYLGTHVNSCECLVIVSGNDSKAILVEPLWYNGMGEQLLELTIGKQFRDTARLMGFVRELHSLLEIGTKMFFQRLRYTRSKISFNLMKSENNQVWRNFEMIISNNTIKSYHCKKDGVVEQKVPNDETNFHKLFLTDYTSPLFLFR